MGRKKKSENGEEVEKTPKIAKDKPLSADELMVINANFLKYKALEVQEKQLKAQLAEVEAGLCDVVKAIYDVRGAGPYGFKGTELTAVKRGELYFFRGRSEDVVQITA